MNVDELGAIHVISSAQIQEWRDICEECGIHDDSLYRICAIEYAEGVRMKMERNNITLFAFEEIPILLQYLYMSEDHKILIHNSIGVPLEIYVVTNSEGDIFFRCRNLNFPELEPMDYTKEVHPENLLRIICQLKKEPAAQYPQAFDNRWDEIRDITLTNLALNKPNYDRVKRQCGA